MGGEDVSNDRKRYNKYFCSLEVEDMLMSVTNTVTH